MRPVTFSALPLSASEPQPLEECVKRACRSPVRTVVGRHSAGEPATMVNPADGLIAIATPTGGHCEGNHGVRYLCMWAEGVTSQLLPPINTTPYCGVPFVLVVQVRSSVCV